MLRLSATLILATYAGRYVYDLLICSREIQKAVQSIDLIAVSNPDVVPTCQEPVNGSMQFLDKFYFCVKLLGLLVWKEFL